MKYFCLILCISFLIIGIFIKKKIYNPMNFFFSIWLIIIFLNTLQLYGINCGSEDAYEMISIGLIGFFFGSMIACFFRIHSNKNVNIQFEEIRYKFIYFCCYICIFLYLVDLLIVIKYLLSGASLNAIRSWMAYTYDSGKNPLEARRTIIEQTFRVIFMEPFVNALIPLSALEFMSKNRNNKLLILTGIIVLQNIVVGGGGRLIILCIMTNIFFVKNIFESTKHRKFLITKKNIKFIFVVILGASAIICLTSKRSNKSFFEEVYYYIALCVPLLSYWIPEIRTVPTMNGIMSIFGLVRIPCLVLDKLNIATAPNVYYRAQEYIIKANTFQNVGSRFSNSFVTPFFYLYLDGRNFGVCIGMLIFGLICMFSFFSVLRNRNKRNIFIFLLLLQGIEFTFIRWQFIGSSYFLSFFFTFFIFKKTFSKITDKT